MILTITLTSAILECRQFLTSLSTLD